MKLEINSKRNYRKYSNIQRLKKKFFWTINGSVIKENKVENKSI
jgi:hypothetical protein